MSYSLYQLLVSPLITPIVVPYIIPYVTPFKEFRLLLKGTMTFPAYVRHLTQVRRICLRAEGLGLRMFKYSSQPTSLGVSGEHFTHILRTPASLMVAPLIKCP